MSKNKKQPAPERAETEPTIAAGGGSAWPFVLLGVVLFGCFLHVENTGGAFRADVFQAGMKTPPPAANEPASYAGSLFFLRGCFGFLFVVGCLVCVGRRVGRSSSSRARGVRLSTCKPKKNSSSDCARAARPTARAVKNNSSVVYAPFGIRNAPVERPVTRQSSPTHRHPDPDISRRPPPRALPGPR